FLTRWGPRAQGEAPRSSPFSDVAGRRWDQVAANGGVAAFAAAIHGLTGSPLAFAAAAGAIAEATADTWATEVGRWSRTRPRMIRPRRPARLGPERPNADRSRGSAVASAPMDLPGQRSLNGVYPDHGRLSTARITPPKIFPETFRQVIQNLTGRGVSA